MKTFSVRCFFRWNPRDDQRRKNLYEERITLWQAESADHALSIAEAETKLYATGHAEFLEFPQSYELFDSVPGSGVEIFSLLRESDLEPKQYIDAFFDTGEEHQQHC